MLKMKKVIILFLSFFFFIQVIAFPSSHKERKESEVVVLFKMNRYSKIVNDYPSTSGLEEDELFLIGKSWERLGVYREAKRFYKSVVDYRENLWPFAMYYIGLLETLDGNLDDAIWWYRELLESIDYIPEEIDRKADVVVLLQNVYEELLRLGLTDRERKKSVEKLLKHAVKVYYNAYYYLGLLYQRWGELDDAAEVYIDILRFGNDSLKAKVITLTSKDKRLLTRIISLGISAEQLVEMALDLGLYYSARYVSYYLENDIDALAVRASCYFSLGNYSAASISYYRHFKRSKSPESLLKAAFSKYKIRRYKEARRLLDLYADSGGSLYDEEYLYLMFLLNQRKLDIDKLVEHFDILLANYRQHEKIEWLLYRLFYRILDRKGLEEAVEFLYNRRIYIVSPEYRAWAYYLLGLFKDSRFFQEAALSDPGSYYYFSSLKYIELEPKALKRADALLRKKRYEEALDKYILLYGKGVEREYVRSKVYEIMEATGKYHCLLTLTAEKTRSSLVYLMELGVTLDLKELLLRATGWGEENCEVIYFYILSKISYIDNDLYDSLFYSEKLLFEISSRYRLFLPREILKLNYPPAYLSTVSLYLDEIEGRVDACFVLALIREESRFRYNARSNRGALGLMQLMPETAKWINNGILRRDDLLNPKINIETGIKYLGYLFDRFEEPVFVLAAYNGGPNNLRKWINDYYLFGRDEFIEFIPFPETRRFVKKVLQSYNMYRLLYPNQCGANLEVD